MRRGRAIGIGLVLGLGGTLANLGCGTRLVGRVSRDGSVPEAGAVEAGMEVAGADGGADALADARPDLPPLPPPNLPTVCTADGWCWTHPLPTGDQFVDAFKVDDGVWLVGAAGTVLRIAGDQLTALPSPTSALATIWANGEKDVWVGGKDGQFRWDGQGWDRPGLNAGYGNRDVTGFWGCAPADIWAVGTRASRWDGQSWVPVTVPSDVIVPEGGFRAVWGSACDDVWAGSLLDLSGTGATYHFDGSLWTKVETRAVEQIAGIGRSDVWSVTGGRLFHSSGVEPGVPMGDRIVSLTAVGASAVGVMNDAHVVSLLGAGGASTTLPTPAPDGARTLRGWAPDDLWGLGAPGTAVHWNGSGWERHLPAWVLTSDDATRVTGSAGGDVWAVADATLLRHDGMRWQVLPTAGDFGGSIVDLWSPGPNEVWVLGGDDLVHRFKDGDWLAPENPLPGSTMKHLLAITGTGPEDVWIARGANGVLHFDGHDWIERYATLSGGEVNTIKAIWAAGPDDLWAVGDGISHWAGGWTAAPRFPSNMVGIGGPYVGVAGTGPSDVHLLLASGYVVKVTDGGTLTEELSTGRHPVALTAAAPSGVWAMFDDPAGRVSRLFQIRGDTDGGAPVQVVGPAGLNAIWSAADGTLWAAGKNGSLLRRAPAP